MSIANVVQTLAPGIGGTVILGGLTILVNVLLSLVQTVLFIVLMVLAIRALLKYLRENNASKEKTEIRKPLGEALKEQRLRCNMTQEFVAETVGVSRQAVSKWENGTSEPSTTNLCAIAKLYGIPPEELLRTVDLEK